MCTEAIVNGVYASTQAELASALGITMDDLVIGDQYKDQNGVQTGRDPQCCLCPVDGERTAKAYGWRFRYLDWDKNMGEMEFTR